MFGSDAASLLPFQDRDADAYVALGVVGLALLLYVLKLMYTDVRDVKVTRNMTACFAAVLALVAWYARPMPYNVFVAVPGAFIGYGAHVPIAWMCGDPRVRLGSFVRAGFAATVGVFVLLYLPWTWFVTHPCPCMPNWYGTDCHVRCPPCVRGTIMNDRCDCACPLGYSGKRCELDCPRTYTGGPCNGRGRCPTGNETSGKCVCDDGYGGVACHAKCPTHRAKTCNGHGECQEGRCHCRDGYYGSECTECTSQQACSGHGQCYDWGCSCLYGWADAGGRKCATCSETHRHPWQFGKLDAATCVQCPVDAFGRVCSTRGRCQTSANTPGRATCVCREGYTGAACQLQCPRHNGTTCGGNGRCQSDGTCQCIGDFRGPACQLKCPKCTTGRGICGVNATCHCDLGFTGDLCEQTCPNCGTSGTCQKSLALGSTAGVCKCTDAGKWGPTCRATCTCSGHGYCRNGMDTKTDAMRSRDLFTSPPCVAEVSASKLDAHNSHVVNGSRVPYRECSNIGGCACEYPYAGSTCQTTCPSTSPWGTCSGKGRCMADGTCQCVDGFGGPACQQCLSDQACRNGGTCRADKTCACKPGFAGPSCEQCSNPNFDYARQCRECKSWQYGPKCDKTCPCDLTQGNCSWGVYGSGQCTSCRSGFFGVQCKRACHGITTKEGQTTGCYGNGVCQDSGKVLERPGSGNCTCSSAQYALPNCATCMCSPNATCVFGAKCQCHPGFWGTNCWQKCPKCQHGTCTSAGTCQCQPGYWGVLCDRKCASASDTAVCSGHGTCTSQGTCVCADGYAGDGCYYATGLI